MKNVTEDVTGASVLADTVEPIGVVTKTKALVAVL